MAARKRRGTAIVTFENPDEIRVEDYQHGWRVWARFRFSEGAPRIVELRVHSEDGPDGPVPPGGITTGVLRDLSFTALYDALGREDDASAFTLTWRGLDPDENFLAVRRPGRRGRDDHLYAVWAERYLAKSRRRAARMWTSRRSTRATPYGAFATSSRQPRGADYSAVGPRVGRAEP